MNALLEVSLRHRLGKFLLDLEFVMGNETGVLFGPSGSGKSLTLRLIAGLERPECGHVRLGGRTLLRRPGKTDIPARNRHIGMVFQDLALFPHMTALENVAFGVENGTSHGIDCASKWLQRVGLEERSEAYPHQLSGGERQRIALARALAPQPDLVLLDEPFSALDSPLRRSLRRELKRLHRETGIPLLYVTHQIEDVCSLGDRIFLIRDGHLTGVLSGKELRSGNGTGRSWHQLGWGNMIRGTVEPRRGGTWFVWREGSLLLPPHYNREGTASAFISPDGISLLYPDLPVDDELSRNIINGRIVESYSIGNRTHLYVTAAGIDWQIEFPSQSYRKIDLREGRNISFSIHPKNITIVDDDH